MKNVLPCPSRGFTLLELLVVLAIVAALLGIAVPQYSNYRKRAYDARAMSDLRNAAIAEEVYFLDSESYLSCTNKQCASLPGLRQLSGGVTLQITATASGFTGTSTHAHGSGKIYRWDTENGGFQD